MYIEQMQLLEDEPVHPIVIDSSAVALHDWVAANLDSLPADEAAALLIFGGSWLETRSFRASMADDELLAA